MKRKKRKGVQEDGWGGRRSNEPTSHGVVSTRAPLPLFSFSSPLPTSLHLFLLPSSSSTVLSTVFFLRPPAEPSCLLLRLSYPSPLYYSYFHARVRSAMWFDDHPHARFFSVCVRRSARVTPGTCNLRGVRERRYAKRPTTLCREAAREREAVLLLNFCTVWLRRRGNSRVP